MTATNVARTRAVLGLVLKERVAQEARYGEANLTIKSGTGPETRWLLPYTSASATDIQQDLRDDYEAYEEDTGEVTWVHLVREEFAEACERDEDDPRLAAEVLQVAALAVSWLERLGIVRCEACPSLDGVHEVTGRRFCTECLEGAVVSG